MGRYSRDEIAAAISEAPFWYHKIDLGGIVTPGLDFDDIWALIRQVRDRLDYREKTVLDIASFDGLWAFEAERLGAAEVVATDVLYEHFRNFLLCHRFLESRVVPFFNVSPYTLVERLDVVSRERRADGRRTLFDIVQHLGLLYHLRDPLLSLAQARSMLRRGGQLVIETACYLDSRKSLMLYNAPRGDHQRIYPDDSTWWIPSELCLVDMLESTLFRVDRASITRLPLRHQIGRVCLMAEAIGPEQCDGTLAKEVLAVYRNPGLVPEDV